MTLGPNSITIITNSLQLSITHMRRSTQLSGSRGFPVRNWPLAMCRGELSAVITRLSVCEAGESG